MAALIPAIIDFIVSRARRGGGGYGGGYGGGGYGKGGRPQKSEEEKVREFMEDEARNEINNISKASGRLRIDGPDSDSAEAGIRRQIEARQRTRASRQPLTPTAPSRSR